MLSTIPAITLEKFTTFGDLLRYLRRRAGITQMELALEVGYSDAQISRLEQNLRMPDIPTIEARFVPALHLEDDPKVVARLIDLAANVRREDAPSLGLCPYKGLTYFDESDADLFVGRELLTEKITERVLRLASNRPTRAPRFLAVVGASGSGKSSLVRAGLAPALRWNKSSADWNIQILTPGAHPLESLAIGLTQENASIVEAARLMDDLARDRRSLHLFTRREGSKDGPRLLLIVDQFEELFTLCRSEDERPLFIGNLLTAASESDGLTLVVISLRADFYSHCAGYDPLREALAEQQEYIGAMTSEELRRIIVEPARRGRWEFEAGLVDLLLHDVGSEPGALPLLSHALYETWQRRRGRMMTLSGYTSSGGVRGAIAETAEAVFSDHFTSEQKAIARRVFLRLTELGDETATGDTRRRATFDELILKPEEKDLTQNVLKILADSRLIITTENCAEVAHEALIREWPTLRGWLLENRESLRLHRQLTDSALEWVTRDYGPDMLYRGARLAQAVEWADSRQDELNVQELKFLKASQEFAECETIEKEAQRQRELDAARRLAESEGRRAEEQVQASRLLRKRNYYLIAALLITLVMALSAGFLGWRAQMVSQLAASRELAAAAISNLEVDSERSILLAMEAVSVSYTLEAENALHQSIMASRIEASIPAFETGSPIQVAYRPDGSQLAAASADGLVKVWNSSDGKLFFTVKGHYAAFSPNGDRLVTILADDTVKLWNADNGEEIALPSPIIAGENAVFSPDGSLLATVTPVNLPRVWDLQSGKELVNFPGHTDYVSYVFFSPDGKRLLTTSDDGTARLWDVVSGQQVLTLSDHLSIVWTAAFSPDGKRIASTSEAEAYIWDATSGEKLLTLSGHTGAIYAVAFSPDGRQLATSGLDRKVKLWDAATGRELFTLTGHTGAVTSLSFDSTGPRLATGSDDGSVKIWNLAPSREWLILPAGVIHQVAFSPVCDKLQTTGDLCTTRLAGVGDDHATIWDNSTGEELFTLTNQDNLTKAVAYSPDGKFIVTAGDDLHVEIWDTTSGTETVSWQAHTGLVNALAVHPQGKSLVTASEDYKVKVWDITTIVDNKRGGVSLLHTISLPSGVKSLAISQDGEKLAAGLDNGTVKVVVFSTENELLTLRGHTNSVMSVSFSPDGKKIATASLDGTARVWDAGTGLELITLSGHSSAVMAVGFSLDGKRVATASRDGSAKLWDSETGQEQITLPGGGMGLNSMAFSPDGKWFAVSGDDGVRVYLLSMDDLVALARTRVTRSLSSQECQKYLHHQTEACQPPIVTSPTTQLLPAANGRICQVATTGSIYDNYFNSMMYKGIEDSARLFGWEATALQSDSLSDYRKNLQTLINSDCFLTVAPVGLFDEIQRSAEVNPDEKFMMMDFVYDPPLENIWNQVYATDQAAFLSGYLAASVTRSGKVGVFGGLDIPQVTDFMDGFALGVAYHNRMKDTHVEVLGWDVDRHEGLFVGGFCCTSEGRQMAQRLLAEGADIILPVAGKTVGWGAGAEVQNHGNAWLIGVDTDWSVTMPEFTDTLLTSIEKRFDVSIVEAASAIQNGAFSGGIHTGTLETGEVRISPFHNLGWLISPEINTELESIKADIISGKIATRP